MSNETRVIVPQEFARREVVQADPMALIANAVQQGMSPETIKSLLDLRDRMEATEARKAFVAALNAFKANPPKIRKNAEVDFTSQKGRTHYKYATLDNVSDTIGAALANVGLSFRWDTEQTEGGLIVVTCVLTHVLGHSERVTLRASADTSGNKNSIQAIVSTVSYLQRQTLLSATGMAVQGTDDDAQQGKANQMADGVKADFLAAIEACADMESAEALWGTISKATVAAGDVVSHDELKAAMIARRKILKGKA